MYKLLSLTQMPLPLVLKPFPILRGRSDRSHATGSIAWLLLEGDVAGTDSEEEQATMPFFLNFDRQLQNYVYVHHTIKWTGPHYVANVSLQQCSVSWFAGIKCTGWFKVNFFLRFLYTFNSLCGHGEWQRDDQNWTSLALLSNEDKCQTHVWCCAWRFSLITHFKHEY